jgi:hypothetical protein
MRTGMASAMLMLAAMTATTADAQKYYARQTLHGLQAAPQANPPVTDPAQEETPPTYGVWSLAADYTQTSACGTTARSTYTRLATCSTASCDPATKPTQPTKQSGCSMSCSSAAITQDVRIDYTFDASFTRVAGTIPATATTVDQRIAAAKALCESYVPDATYRALGCHANATNALAIITPNKTVSYKTLPSAGSFIMQCALK